MKFQMWWHLFLSLLAVVLGFLVVEISTVTAMVLWTMAGWCSCFATCVYIYYIKE